jgi:hypothetical protein
MLVACAEGAEDGSQDQDTTPSAQEEELTYSDDAMLIDFGADGEESWYAVNDTVMGGVSNGDVTFDDNSMVFEGAVSTDNNGGFASVRSPQDETDLSMYSRVLIRMKSEGQPFSMVIADSPLWYADQFKYDIESPNEDWNTIEILFEDFEEYTIMTGYPEPTGAVMTSEDAEEIIHIELMSKQFEDGDFRIEVDYIAFD